MRDFLARLFDRLLRRTADHDPVPTARPYSCPYVGGPTRHRTGECPPRGEDSPLVRPYLLAHERQQGSRRVLLFAAQAPEFRVGRGGGA